MYSMGFTHAAFSRFLCDIGLNFLINTSSLHNGFHQNIYISVQDFELGSISSIIDSDSSLNLVIYIFFVLIPIIFIFHLSFLKIYVSLKGLTEYSSDQ